MEDATLSPNLCKPVKPLSRPKIPVNASRGRGGNSDAVIGKKTARVELLKVGKKIQKQKRDERRRQCDEHPDEYREQNLAYLKELEHRESVLEL